MPPNSKFPAIEERDPMAEESNQGKRQVNYYVDPDNDKNIAEEVFRQKFTLGNRMYSATQLTNDALRLFFVVLAYHRQSGSTTEPLEFVRDALKAFLPNPKKR